MKIMTYAHHGRKVSVREDLLGKHKKYCLCHQCQKFIPTDRMENCRIAELLFAVDRTLGLVTPVWECPEFLEN